MVASQAEVSNLEVTVSRARRSLRWRMKRARCMLGALYLALGMIYLQTILCCASRQSLGTSELAARPLGASPALSYYPPQSGHQFGEILWLDNGLPVPGRSIWKAPIPLS